MKTVQIVSISLARAETLGLLSLLSIYYLTLLVWAIARLSAHAYGIYG